MVAVGKNRMGLFKKKCEYCKEKIDKGSEMFRQVKDPVYTGKVKKAFCCEDHADSYEEDSKNAKKCESCCG